MPERERSLPYSGQNQCHHDERTCQCYQAGVNRGYVMGQRQCQDCGCAEGDCLRAKLLEGKLACCPDCYHGRSAA